MSTLARARRRFLRSGVVGSAEEDDVVRVEEEELLGKFGRRLVEVEADPGLWVKFNRRMRGRSLRLEDFRYYLELKKSCNFAESLMEELGLFEEGLPSLLLTFYSEKFDRVFVGDEE